MVFDSQGRRYEVISDEELPDDIDVILKVFFTRVSQHKGVSADVEDGDQHEWRRGSLLQQRFEVKREEHTYYKITILIYIRHAESKGLKQ